MRFIGSIPWGLFLSPDRFPARARRTGIFCSYGRVVPTHAPRPRAGVTTDTAPRLVQRKIRGRRALPPPRRLTPWVGPRLVRVRDDRAVTRAGSGRDSWVPVARAFDARCRTSI